MDTRELIEEMADMLAAGDLIPALDKFYDKNIEVSAVGAEEKVRSGKKGSISSGVSRPTSGPPSAPVAGTHPGAVRLLNTASTLFRKSTLPSLDLWAGPAILPP